MKLPRGRLVRSRVVTDPRTVLVDALDREVTGYAVFEPQNALLLDGEGSAIVTFRDGVPALAYHTGTGRGGPPALADLAAEGPYQLELFAVDPGELAAVHDQDAFRVPPDVPAERLAGDQALADRTRTAAPVERRREATVPAERGRETSDPTDPGLGTADHVDASGTGAADGLDGDAPADDTDADQGEHRPGAVEAFLDDEEKIEAIREEARAEAEQRAEEWGFGVGARQVGQRSPAPESDETR